MNVRARRAEAIFRFPVLVAALLVIPVISVEQAQPGQRWEQAAALTNWLIWIVFAAELLTMLILVDHPWRWLRDHPLELLVVVLTPPFLPASLQAMRALRLLRLLRLARLATVGRAVFSLNGLRYVTFLALLTALGGGAAFAAAEGNSVSTWDGVWWSLTTMTTVGYGDVSPTTDAGRLIAIGVMLVGIGFVALLTAALAQRFVAVEVEQIGEQIEADVGQAEMDVQSSIAELREMLDRLEMQLSSR